MLYAALHAMSASFANHTGYNPSGLLIMYGTIDSAFHPSMVSKTRADFS